MNYRHGAYQLERLMRRGELAPTTEAGELYVAIQDALAAGRGGWDRCTVEERLLIERAAALALICRTIEQHVVTTGILQGGQLVPVLAKGFATYAESLRRTLLALGLRPDVVDRLDDIAEHAATLAAEEHAA